MDRTTLTAALKPLEREGLIEVKVDPEDRRGRLLVLTEAGGKRLATAVPIWRDTHAAIESVSPALDFNGLRSGLAALASNQAFDREMNA